MTGHNGHFTIHREHALPFRAGRALLARPCPRRGKGPTTATSSYQLLPTVSSAGHAMLVLEQQAYVQYALALSLGDPSNSYSYEQLREGEGG